MEEDEHEHLSDEDTSRPLLVTAPAPRRQSSTSRPLNAIRRMGSVLLSNRNKESSGSSTNTRSLLNIRSNDNESKESFLTQLDRLADHDKAWSNPAPGLGYKPVKAATFKESPSQPAFTDNIEPFAAESIEPLPTSKPSRLSRFSRSTAFGREITPASLSRVPENPTPYPALPPRRSTNVPITTLMAPIQPGQELPRTMIPRSSTTGNFRYTPNVQTPGFMRPTSSSAARQNTGIPMPTGGISNRRPSITTQPRVQPSGHRQSLPVSSPLNQLEAQSDLPFRRLYGSPMPSKQDRTTTHLPLVTSSEHPRRGSDSAEDTPKLINPHYCPGTLPIINPSDIERLMADLPNHAEAAKHAERLQFPPTPPSNPDEELFEKTREAYRKFVGAPEPDLTHRMESGPEHDDQPRVHFEDQRTPTQREIRRGSEHDDLAQFDFSDQQTPTQRNVNPGSEVDAQAQHQREEERYRRLPDLGSTMDWAASVSDVQRGKQPVHGKQPVRMAISDVDRPKYTAIAKQQESYESSEGNTVIHGGEEDEGQEDDNLYRIYHPMPTSYWSGRFTSLSDRFRGEALAAIPMSPSHPMMNDTIRLRRVLNELSSQCQTIEARRSLFQYWKAYASTYGWPRPHELMSAPQIAAAAPAPAPAPEPEPPVSDKKKKKGGVLGRLGSMSFRRKSGN